ncbi:MAG TPA: glycoside hydrolase family 9 protein [Streptosporangiaceae bacterium]|nr:glycoside hydrolase family 9 protein [Streptosporangiaceae bacterium]
MSISRRTRLTAVSALGAIAVAAAAAAVASPAAVAAAAAGAAHSSPAEVRVNQVGYATTASKVAFAMLPARVARVPFTVTDGSTVVYRGTSSDDVGSWNSSYGAVYQLSFSSVRAAGTYKVHVGSAVSPAFQIASGQVLYTHLVNNAVRYFTSERDGADVDSSVLDRQPANLTDEQAYVYAAPKYDDNDNLLGGFTKVSSTPVDVSGGWFDAGGGYEKFAYTASYSDALMMIAQRDFPGESKTLAPEANFGLQWISKLWNPVQKVMYVQVGIGNGSAPSKGYPDGKIQGDYNFWFLPQDEDKLNVTKGGSPGPTAYYVKYRPVFEAAAPGQKVSPDLAGRFAADYALGAQLKAAIPVSAGQLLARARSVYADARTTDVGQIVTTYPDDYYPGTQWKSDMLWGAAEIALADEATSASYAQTQADLQTAAYWAKQYIAQGHPATGDTFNLYDDGAVAEAELLQAMKNFDGPAVIPASTLLRDMAAQLRTGEAWAKGDPFQLGTQLGPADAAPHAFGLYTTNALYQKYGGSDQFEAFAQQQLNFALGANAWGSSFVVGAGSTYPRCMQSEIANVTGLTQLGAATDGPSSTANFTGLGTVTGMKACSAGDYTPFDTKTASYEDNAVAWPSVEPADDYTAGSLFAFALGAAGLG